MDFLQNPENRAAIISLFASAFFGLLMVAPFVFAPERGMEWGFAVSLISLLLAVTAFFTAWFFYARARVLDATVGNEMLAHWTYSEGEWAAYRESEYHEQNAMNKGLFLMVAGISALVGLIFLIIDWENGWPVCVVLAAVVALVGVVAILVPWLNRESNRTRGEALIGKRGVLLNGAFTEWTVFGSELENAAVRNGKVPVLEIEFSAFARYGRDYRTLRVPVPKGKLEEAKTIASKLMKEAE